MHGFCPINLVGTSFFFSLSANAVDLPVRGRRSYTSLVPVPKNNLDIQWRLPTIKNKTEIKIFTVPLHELTEFEFIKLLQLNLNLDSQYTILFQYTLYER